MSIRHREHSRCEIEARRIFSSELGRVEGKIPKHHGINMTGTMEWDGHTRYEGVSAYVLLGLLRALVPLLVTEGVCICGWEGVVRVEAAEPHSCHATSLPVLSRSHARCTSLIVW